MYYAKEPVIFTLQGGVIVVRGAYVVVDAVTPREGASAETRLFDEKRFQDRVRAAVVMLRDAYPKHAWQEDVREGRTERGYADWLREHIDAERDAVEGAKPQGVKPG